MKFLKVLLFTKTIPTHLIHQQQLNLHCQLESRVKINVYNTLGQLVETLVDKEMESGYHEVNFDASRLASGVYLYQLQAGEISFQ